MTNSLKDLQTKLDIVKLKEEGYNGNQIAEKLNIPARTIQDFLAKNTWGKFWEWYESMEDGGEEFGDNIPKIYKEAKDGSEEKEVYDTYKKIMADIHSGKLRDIILPIPKLTPCILS